MKETGLMFKAPLVRAILAGQKTQTRRVLKQATGLSLSVGIDDDSPGVAELSWLYGDGPGHDVHESIKRVTCPMGKPGDRIYVRETHAHHPEFAQMAFRADGEEFEDADGFLWEPKWTPAIHMKKEEARIWLEITGVRVERLQQISRADAIAEGIKFFNNDHECGAKNYLDRTDMDYSLCPTDSFETLWKSTGGDWAANPWVWVIDFKTISTTGRPA